MNPTTPISRSKRSRPQARRRPAGQRTSTVAGRRSATEAAPSGPAVKRDGPRSAVTARAAATANAKRRALSPAPASPEAVRALWAMSAAERVQAMWAGDLVLGQLCHWTSRRPREVPLLGREFSWIVVNTPEWAEAGDRPANATDTRSTP
jgi:hypothetical protein